MTTQHTPGPWRIWRDMDPKEPLSIVGPSEDFTCIVAMENTQAQANARLIAAAPELLDACKDALESLTCIVNPRKPRTGCDCYCCESARVVREAIAKASV